MNPKIEIKDYSLWFGSDQVLKSIAMTVPRNQVVAVFGPAGSGKSGLLRSINRMAELDPRQRHTGDILMDGASIFAPEAKIHHAQASALEDSLSLPAEQTAETCRAQYAPPLRQNPTPNNKQFA